MQDTDGSDGQNFKSLKLYVILDFNKTLVRYIVPFPSYNKAIQKKTRRKNTMKTRTERHYYANDYRHSRPYPNAAERSYFQEKLLDQVASVVTVLGIIALLFFLVTL